MKFQKNMYANEKNMYANKKICMKNQNSMEDFSK